LDKTGSDALLSAAQICAKYQYPFEKFHYETDDDYILTAIRISGGKGASPLEIKKT
jgi:hypothetical protein